MGEVIEINIVSKDEQLILEFLNFISLQMKDNTIREIVEVMDDWQYKNVEIIETIDLVKAYIGSKVVCITEMRENGLAGVNVEPVGDLLLYDLWFKSTLFSSDVEYFKLIERFIEYISNSEVINNIVIGAIGKETKFEYLGENKETINNAHNVDVWVIEKADSCDDILEEYKIVANIYFDNIHREMFALIKDKLWNASQF